MLLKVGGAGLDGAGGALSRVACSTGSKPGLMHGGRAAGLSLGFRLPLNEDSWLVRGQCPRLLGGRADLECLGRGRATDAVLELPRFGGHLIWAR